MRPAFTLAFALASLLAGRGSAAPCEPAPRRGPFPGGRFIPSETVTRVPLKNIRVESDGRMDRADYSPTLRFSVTRYLLGRITRPDGDRQAISLHLEVVDSPEDVPEYGAITRRYSVKPGLVEHLAGADVDAGFFSLTAWAGSAIRRAEANLRREFNVATIVESTDQVDGLERPPCHIDTPTETWTWMSVTNRLSDGKAEAKKIGVFPGLVVLTRENEIPVTLMTLEGFPLKYFPPAYQFDRFGDHYKCFDQAGDRDSSEDTERLELEPPNAQLALTPLEKDGRIYRGSGAAYEDDLRWCLHEYEDVREWRHDPARKDPLPDLSRDDLDRRSAILYVKDVLGRPYRCHSATLLPDFDI